MFKINNVYSEALLARVVLSWGVLGRKRMATWGKAIGKDRRCSLGAP